MAGIGGGGKGGNGGKGGAPDLINNGNGVNVHPRGMLDAIGFIELAYADEAGGAEIDPRRLTTPVRWEFMEVGFRGGFVSSLILALLSPLAIGVLEKHVSIFGSADPSIFDQFCGLLLALVFSLGYAFFLAGVAKKHLGGYSRAMVSNLLGGVAAAGLVKAIIVFIAFHMLYFMVLTDQNIAWLVQHLYKMNVPYDAAVTIFMWLRDFRGVFLTSAYFVVLSTAVFIAIPYLAMLRTHLRNKSLIEAGVVNVFKDDN